MKNATTELINFLATTLRAWPVDLFTITLSGGAVLRWTGADVPVQVPGGYGFDLGPPIDSGNVKFNRGLSVDGASVVIYPRAADTIGGISMISFAKRNGFDGSTFLLERGYSATPGGELIGTYIRFKGRFSQVKEVTDTEIDIEVASWTELLNVNMPADVYTPACRNVLGDGRCGIDLETYAVSGLVQSVTSASSFDTNLAAATGYFDLGKIRFTSGALSGLKKTIKTFTVGGLVQTIIGFPQAPAVGDSFVAYPGCNLTMATCSGRFNNLIHFRGTPFIPESTTAV